MANLNGVSRCEDVAIGRLAHSCGALPFKFRRQPHAISSTKGVCIVPTDLGDRVIIVGLGGARTLRHPPRRFPDCNPCTLSFIENSSVPIAFSAGCEMCVFHKRSELRNSNGGSVH